MPIEPARLELLSALARKVLWLSSWTIHHANHIRPNTDGLKVGGHQASSASLANIMSALYFSVLRPQDRVAVKPHASNYCPLWLARFCGCRHGPSITPTTSGPMPTA